MNPLTRASRHRVTLHDNAVTRSQAGAATGMMPGPELQERGDAKLFIHSQQIQWLFSIQEASVWMKRRSALLFSVGKF